MNGGGWEGLDMSTICLDMLLGLPHIEIASWGDIYRPNPISSRWTESDNFLSTGTPESRLEGVSNRRNLKFIKLNTH
jgi:hypothetical protein